MIKTTLKILILTAFFIHSFASYAIAQTNSGWYMAGANPQRTSWVPEGVPGSLKPDWVKPMTPHIPQRVQLVAAENKIFVSTTSGLYALDAATGREVWVYPTSMPLGHSPTYHNGTLYVAGFDRKVHAINAGNGTARWVFTAGGTFSANPVVVNNTLYIGGRDGVFYALDIANGSPRWTKDIDSAIYLSPAYDNSRNLVIFSAQNGYAYALNASTGSQAWRSNNKIPSLPGSNWWPVIYQDLVFFNRTIDLREGLTPGAGSLHLVDREEEFVVDSSDGREANLTGRKGNEPGPWVSGNPTLDLGVNPISGKIPIPNYFDDHHDRRNLVAFSLSNGQERKFDTNRNGKPDAPPFLWNFTHSGTMPPPVLGKDGAIYSRTTAKASGAIAAGMLVGWKFDSDIVSLPMSPFSGQSGDWPVDEPIGLSSGGSIIYFNLCCDRVVGSIDTSKANTSYPNWDQSRQWRYDGWKISGYNRELKKFLFHPLQTVADVSQPPAGQTYDVRLYYAHGVNNPPIPYNGRVYLHRSNAIIALSANGSAGQALASSSKPNRPQAQARSKNHLKELLEEEVQDIIAAGHLKPGYAGFHGLGNFRLNGIAPDLFDYFHDPGQTHYVLLRALPHLSSTLQNQVKSYLQQEFQNFPPYQYRHIGWRDGQLREQVNLERAVVNGMGGGPKSGFNPQSFYALWKYAQAGLGNAQNIFNQAKDRLGSPPPDDYLRWRPDVHNAYIAGYIGYLNLQQMAEGRRDSGRQNELNRLLALRANNFTSDLRYKNSLTARNSSPQENLKDRYYYTNLLGWNFMNMVPELSDYLNQHAENKVRNAVNKYEEMLPEWSEAQTSNTQGEGVVTPLYIPHGMFQAKAKILKEPYASLEPHVDAPSYEVGDLFYIDNLVSALEAPGDGSSTPTSIPTSIPDSADVDKDGDIDFIDANLITTNLGTTYDIFDYNVLVKDFGK